MSAMLEKMARAIAQASVLTTNAEVRADAWSFMGWQQRRHAMDVARAALLAIREPDDLLLQPGCAKHTPGCPMSDDRPEECPTFARRRRIWKEQIDAILAEGASE